MQNSNSFITTRKDIQIIKSIHNLSHSAIWKNKKISEYKTRIKKYHLDKQQEQCCYCKRSFRDEFSLVIDIEHILPKSKYKELIFDVEKNLSVSCKRCNMKIKKDDLSFFKVKNKKQALRTPYISKNYKFIHPNLDDYFQHITYENREVNNTKIVKYISKSSKGHYTYKYFELKKIETNYLDKAQGIQKRSRMSINISNKYGEQVRRIMRSTY